MSKNGKGLLAYHNDAASESDARDSPDAASANANAPSSGTDRPADCPSPFPSRGDNALFEAPGSRPSSSCPSYVRSRHNPQQSRLFISKFLLRIITHVATLLLLSLISRCFFYLTLIFLIELLGEIGLFHFILLILSVESHKSRCCYCQKVLVILT